jgi:predicted dehydrogenase
MDAMAKIRWGILSTANIGVKRVIPAILSSSKGVVAAIASRDADRAALIASQFGIPKSYSDYQSLLDDPALDAIYNPRPHPLHVPWTVKALEAGKHVLCEKPIALNANEAGALITARDRTGRHVMEAFMVRCHPQWHRVRELAASGRIGTVRSLQSAFTFSVLDPKNVRNQPQIGGGALYDVGCYPLVTARYIFGTEPERVIAAINRDADLGVDRVTSGILVFPGGEQLTFTSSLQLAPFQRVVLLGSSGRIEVRVPFTPNRDHACSILIDTGAALDGSSQVVEQFDPVDQYMLQCDLAAGVFQGETAQPFPIEDAISGMRVIDALYRSAESGRWETP